MQLIKKYNYADLKREDGDVRLYLTPDGESLPSVTSVLSKTKDRSFLKKWRERVGEKKAEQIIQDSTKIGTALHLYIERFANGKKYKDLTKIGKQAEKMAKKIIKEAFPDITEVWGSEVHLYYPKKYAGTTDMVCLYKNKPTIVDFKQSNRPKKREWVQDYLMQLAAYAQAHNKLFGTDIEQGVILMCSRDLTFQRFELEGANFHRAFDTFMKKLDSYLETLI